MSDSQELKYASIVLDEAVDKHLDYLIPPHLSAHAAIGKRVSVPVRGKPRKGTLIGFKDQSSFEKVHPILEFLSEESLLSPDLFALADWMSRYYCAPLRKILKNIFPPVVRKGMEPKKQQLIRNKLSFEEIKNLLLDTHFKITAPQKIVLETILKERKPIFLSKLQEVAKVSRSPIESLVKRKILDCSVVEVDRSILEDIDFFKTSPKVLNPEQAAALSHITDSIDKSDFAVHLLYGVTGSGKTEVYLQAIEHALKQGKGVIMLVPEIALTSQTIERFKSRFDEKISVLHHKLSDGERLDAWNNIHKGLSPIVIGARSALFSPTANLGLIIIDEEHESSYKQTDEEPCYHGRDVAVMRAKLKNCPIILGSATPSLESYYNAQMGKYQLHMLTNRAESASLPKVHIIDMKKESEKANGFTYFSQPLLDGIKSRYEKGEQAVLFLNRRGYYTSTLCLSCGHSVKCPHCDVSLTTHRGSSKHACHLCGYEIPHILKSCPYCHSVDGLKSKGFGTEQIEAALHRIFPGVRTLRVDADTTKHKGSHDLLLKQFRTGKADVLIGTQMIAKGLHFPAVTLVGVISADAGLNIPDFRASENTFQLLTQVAGRSGRGQLPGEVFIQAFNPENLTIQLAAKQDFLAFYKEEIGSRELFDYPPLTQMVKVSFSGTSESTTQEYAENFRKVLLHHLTKECEVFPTQPAGRVKVKDRFTFHFLIKTKKVSLVTPVLSHLKNLHDSKKGIRLLVDVNPLSTFF